MNPIKDGRFEGSPRTRKHL